MRNDTTLKPLENRLVHSFWRNIAWASGLPPYENVPHLRGTWLQGRLPYLLAKGGVLNDLIEAGKLAAESEKNMCSFWIENQLFLLIVDPKAIFDYRIYGHRFIERLVPSWDYFPGPSLSNRKDGPDLQFRNLFKTVMHQDPDIKRLQSNISQISDQYLANYLQPSSDPIDATAFFREYVMKLSSMLFMGVKEIDAVDPKPLLEYLANLLAGDFLHALNFIGFMDNPVGVYTSAQFSEFYCSRKKTIDEFKQLFWENYKNHITASENFFHSFLKLCHESYPNSQQGFESFIAGSYFYLIGDLLTTADALPIIVQQICQHPVVLQNILNELNAAESDLAGDLMSSLPYLDMVIKETLRLYPPIPIIPIRSCAETFELNGVTVRKGDKVIVSPYLTHRNERIWENPNEFVPERFAKTIPSGGFIPFGLGPRECVGQRYGQAVLKTFIAKLFSKFDIRVECVASKEDLVGVSLYQETKLQLSPRMSNNFKMRI